MRYTEFTPYDLVLLVQGLGVGVVSTLSYATAIARLGPARSAVIGSLAPVLASLGAVPLLGEILTPAIALGVGIDPTTVIVGGLIGFGIIFALNSAVHSYLILAYTDNDKVAMNVGFYYMANAGGRLAGTVLSGLLYQAAGLVACLWASAIFVLAAGALSLLLPASHHQDLAAFDLASAGD